MSFCIVILFGGDNLNKNDSRKVINKLINVSLIAVTLSGINTAVKTMIKPYSIPITVHMWIIVLTLCLAIYVYRHIKQVSSKKHVYLFITVSGVFAAIIFNLSMIDVQMQSSIFPFLFIAYFLIVLGSTEIIKNIVNIYTGYDRLNRWKFITTLLGTGSLAIATIGMIISVLK